MIPLLKLISIGVFIAGMAALSYITYRWTYHFAWVYDLVEDFRDSMTAKILKSLGNESSS